MEESVHDVLGTLDRTSQEKDDLDNLTIFGDHGVESLSLASGSVLLVPSIKILGASKDSSGSLIDGLLDVLEVWLQLDIMVVKIDIDLEEGVLVVRSTSAGLSNNSILHSIKRILGSIQEGLIEVPEIVSLDLFGFFAMDVFLVLDDVNVGS